MIRSVLTRYGGFAGLLILVSLVLAIHFLFFPIIDHVDTMSYHAFARYLITGKYIWTTLDNYTIVSTGSPPLYSVLLAILYSVVRADIWIHLIHILAYGGSVMLFYLTCRYFFPEKTAAVLTIVFSLIPGNLIYLSFILPEIIAQFLYMLYVYLLIRFTKNRNILALSLAVAVGFFSGLWKYSFMMFGFFSLGYFLLQAPRKIHLYIFPVIGIGILIGWIFVQHQMTGVWGLSMATDLRYNLQMMYRGKVLPSEDHPSMKEIRKYIPENVDLRRAYWDLEPYLVPYIGYDIIKMSKIVGDVGKEAMREHPFVYARLVLRSFFGSYIGGPFNVVIFQDANGNIVNNYCIDFESFLTCRTIIPFGNPDQVYASLYNVYKLFYWFVFPVFAFAVFIPSLMLGLFFTKTTRLLAVVYLVGTVPIAMATWEDPRYILPFYPSLVLIPALVMPRVRMLVSRWQKKRNRT